VFGPNITELSEKMRATCQYRKGIQFRNDWAGKKMSLEFQGAMQATELLVNGQKAGEYSACGYDSFSFDITPFVHPGENTITVKVDNRRHPEIPPDGKETDYILFGGLYRDVFLHVTDPVHLTFPWEARQAGVRFTYPKISESVAVVHTEATVRNESDKPRLVSVALEIRDGNGKLVTSISSEEEIPVGQERTFIKDTAPIPNPHLWSPEDPYLYKAMTIVRDGERELDRTETRLGLRWVKFDKEKGFFLNGQHLKLIGVNCHQTWPFIGNAVPNGLHRRDAEQIKAMGVNWVRLSHYPQDPDFLDALDELGLMALEEPATWMDRGPPKWLDNLEKSFRSMIRRDRNHPCIIVWGACINHHAAEPRLVQAAKEEDPTRDRGQDTVPTPMNFHPGIVSGNGALSLEHTGHTFPTYRGQRESIRRIPDSGAGHVESMANREYEQAKRHWEQVNAAYLREDNAGIAVWCMYDYNTFHNMDENGIVWHGVCDLFRIPKYSYYWHMSELTSKPMAYVVRIDSTRAAVFSNCEQVRLLQDEGHGYKLVAIQKPDTSFIGTDGKETRFALHHPPFHFTVSPLAWALKAEGLIGNSVKAVYEWKQFGAAVALTLEADRPTITADGADLSRIIVSAVDANGTSVDTSKALITFSVEGFGQLIGENPVKLRCGKNIILAQSAFRPGQMTITAASAGLHQASVIVKTVPIGPDVDMPKDLPVHPSPRPIASSGRLSSSP
jgi:beta-galactosidase